MSGWSIHLENKKYVIRMKARSTEQTDAGAAEEGEKAGTYSTRAAAAAKIRELEMKQKQDVRIAAAKVLLGA